MNGRLLLALPVVMVASILGAPPALADDRRCTGTIGAVHIDGNVIVPAGATCRLIRTRVDDNVFVRDGAVLVARGVRVGGNIQATEHRRVLVAPRKVDDTVVRSRVGGDIQLFDNFDLLTLNNNKIGGNLQCKENFEDPTGANNKVKGNAEDQCEAIALEV